MLLEAVREHGVGRYLQISTDEVYGSIAEGSSAEDSDLDPSSPYSASKAGADLLVLAYHRTFGTPVVITRSSNNYGPYQYPEKIIPLFITNALDDQPLPVYGDGAQRARLAPRRRQLPRRSTSCCARASRGEVYNIGGGNEVANLDLTRRILRAARQGRRPDPLRQRPARPRPPLRGRLRQAARAGLGARGRRSRTASPQTVAWYRDNRPWWEQIKSGEWRALLRGAVQGTRLSG